MRLRAYMGFASMGEDISTRYFENSAAARSAPNDPTLALANKLKRMLCATDAIFTHYSGTPQPLTELRHDTWERIFKNVHDLHALLAPAALLDEGDPDTWSAVMGIKNQVRDFFNNFVDCELLSRAAFQRMHRRISGIVTRCHNLIRELRESLEQFQTMDHFQTSPTAHREIQLAIEQLNQVSRPLEADLDKMQRYEELATEAIKFWEAFLKQYYLLAVQHHFRPALQDLDRFQLTEDQEQYVVLDHHGAYRIRGSSGSGKTIILIHRALRLAKENPTHEIRVFTINRVLASLLDDAVRALNGRCPSNLHISAFYDFLLECVSLFESPELCRLDDERSGERSAESWNDFYEHAGDTPEQNVFAGRKARQLIRYIESRGEGVDASRYLYEEMVYIRSAYRERSRYDYQSDRRRSRSIALNSSRRSEWLNILNRWEQWLAQGHLCDVDGMPTRAAKYFDDDGRLAKIRRVKQTHSVLIDEFQDFSTLELLLTRKLVSDPDGENRFFFVGDRNQKVYPKHHDSRLAGFDFRGRAGILTRNVRNTRQILKAAYNLSQAFPPKEDEEESDVGHPDMSSYEGGRPVVFKCTSDSHLDLVLRIIGLRAGRRVAVVTASIEFLREVRRGARRCGLPCHELIRNEDLDLWKAQSNRINAGVVVSGLEAVKGFEFDTVIACHLSDGVIPRRDTPEAEYWRQAAIVYAALTRARDELIITYVGEPSVFLKTMLADVEEPSTVDATRTLQVLAVASRA